VTKIVANYFLQLTSNFLNYKPKKLTSTSWQWHSSWKCLSHVNTTSIAIINYYSCKLLTNMVMRCYQLPSTNGWTSFEDYIWCQQNIQLQFWLHFDYANSTDDVVTHGIPKKSHHWFSILEIKSRGQLCCNYDGQCIWPLVRWHVL
jgi:hypothetical protein